MKNEEKPIGRGKFAVMAWEEAKKAGGLSYSPEQIQAILEESGDKGISKKQDFSLFAKLYNNVTRRRNARI